MSSRSLTSLALVIGASLFFVKYIVYFRHPNRLLLAARIVLSILAVCVLLIPLDYCPPFAYPHADALAGALVVAASEIFASATHVRCGCAVSATAALYALLNARHDATAPCSAALFTVSTVTASAGYLLFLRPYFQHWLAHFKSL